MENIQTREQFDNLLHCLQDNTQFAVDTETDGLTPYQGTRMIGMSFWFPEDQKGFYLPVNHPDFKVADEWIEELKGVFPTVDHEPVFFNAMFDLHVLHVEGFKDPENIEDVMLAAQLINENESNQQLYPGGSFKLKYLARKYLGYNADEGEKHLKVRAKELGVDPKKEMYKMPSTDVWFYAVMDTKITWELREFYLPLLIEWKQFDLYMRRNTTLLRAYYPMARNGMRIDVDLTNYLYEQTIREAEELELAIKERIEHKTGLVDCNIRSPKQLQTVFSMLGHKLKSTDVKSLEKISDDSDIAKLILEYRKKFKEARTYYLRFLELVDSNGYIHIDTFAIGTVTGRVSSGLQQMPKEKGYDVKRVFIPPDGYSIVQVDYSNLELRLAAAFAKEQTLIDEFDNGGDVHQLTTDFLSEQLHREFSRHEGKQMNFTLLYGASAYSVAMGEKSGLETRLDKTRDELIPVIIAWHDAYKNFKAAIMAAKKIASVPQTNPSGNGMYRYLQLFNGRVRHYDAFVKNKVHPPYKDGLNFLVQGTGAAVTEESLTRIAETCDPELVIPVLQVHDSIIMYIRNDVLDTVIPEIVEIMENWDHAPRLKVDVEVSEYSWMDLHKWKS